MIKCAAPSGDGVSRALVTGHGGSSCCAFTVDPWPGASCAHRTQPPRPPAEQTALSPLLPTEEPDVQGFPSRTGLAGGAGGLTGLAGGVRGSRAVLGAGPTSRVVLGRTGFAVVSGAPDRPRGRCPGRALHPGRWSGARAHALH